MNRRGFIGSILAAGIAPAIVRAESIMRVAVPKGMAATDGGLLSFTPPRVVAGDLIVINSHFNEVYVVTEIKESDGLPSMRRLRNDEPVHVDPKRGGWCLSSLRVA